MEGVPKKITKPYYLRFKISKAGLVGVFLSARCKSRQQLNAHSAEELRVELDRLHFRELPPEKRTQLFNVPAACNGSKLKGREQTTVFLTIMKDGEHTLSLIPRNGALIEDMRVQELTGQQEVVLSIEKQAEDGDRRPWYVFVLVDMPLKSVGIEATVEKRWRDSDDLKVIVDGSTKRSIERGKFISWYFIGALLRWFMRGTYGERKRIAATFEESSDAGIHYVELYADRTPILHRVTFNLAFTETDAEKRATNVIRTYSSPILMAAREFGVDPVMVGGVIYEEQARNVNFIDTLTDAIGGLLHLNTSVGVGQVRMNIARDLEEVYPALDPGPDASWPGEETFARVEQLKDPVTNIRYVAAKLHFSQARWNAAGFDIAKWPDILGTLYNIEDIQNPITPRAHPEANEFGKGVARNLKNVRMLLGL